MLRPCAIAGNQVRWPSIGPNHSPELARSLPPPETSDTRAGSSRGCAEVLRRHSAQASAKCSPGMRAVAGMPLLPLDDADEAGSAAFCACSAVRPRAEPAEHDRRHRSVGSSADVAGMPRTPAPLRESAVPAESPYPEVASQRSATTQERRDVRRRGALPVAHSATGKSVSILKGLSKLEREASRRRLLSSTKTCANTVQIESKTRSGGHARGVPELGFVCANQDFLRR